MHCLAALSLLAAWSCVDGIGEIARRVGEGMNSGCSNFTLNVCRGDSGFLRVRLDGKWQKIVEKYDPETKTWKEQLLAFGENNEPLTGKTTSISLVNQNFTVTNAEKADQGLYKIKRVINDRSLAVVNLTVLDCPLPVTPASNVSSPVISNITKTKAAPSGTDYTGVKIGVSIAVVAILVVGVIVLWVVKKKSVCRHKESRPVVDLEQRMNGLLSHQHDVVVNSADSYRFPTLPLEVSLSAPPTSQGDRCGERMCL